MREKIAKHKRVIVIFLGILLLAVYGYQLHYPPEPYYDEVHYVKFIQELIFQGNYNVYANNHPPLWHLLVALCVGVFGDFPLVWRIVPFTAGIAALCALYFLTKKITQNSFVAALSVFLMSFDCISFTQARIAMINSLILLFMLLSFSCFLGSFKKDEPFQRRSFRSAGILFGLALASKLVCLNTLLFIVPLLLFELKKRKNERKLILRETLIYFLAAPVLIFACAHIFIPFLKGYGFIDILRIWKFSLNYHLTTKQEHLYASRWWSWPLMLRPIWYYFKGYAWDTPGATASGIICIGNPVIFWLIPVILGYLFWSYFKKKSSASGLVLLGFFTQWLSYALMGRLQFFHHFYTSMPFVAMGLGLLLNRIWQAGRAGKGVVIAYLILVLAMFVYWYPLLVGLTISSNYYLQHMWFRKAWI